MSLLRISIIQTALHWEDKTANLNMLQDKMGSIPKKTEVILLPEMFSTGFSMNNELLSEPMDGPTIAWMKKMAAEKRAVITGSLIAQEQAVYFNRMIWMLPNGDFGFYDKRHLFAFGNEDQHYTPGQKRLIASVNGWKINLQICYDLRFPVWIRQAQQDPPEYDVLVVVANWPLVRSLAWRSLLQARAIENVCYVIGVNRTGVDGRGLEYGGESMLIAPDGEILLQMGREEGIGSYTLDREKLDTFRQKYPFLRDADHFFIEPS